MIEQSSLLSNLTTTIKSDNIMSHDVSIVNNEWNIIVTSSNDDNCNNNNKASSSFLHKSAKSMSSWMIEILVLASIVTIKLLLIALFDHQEQQELLKLLFPCGLFPECM